MSEACTYDRAFIEEQIAALKEALVATQAQLLSASTTQSYSLDTGQTRQSVTKQQISQLKNTRWALLNELQFWQNMLCRGATVYGRPSY